MLAILYGTDAILPQILFPSINKLMEELATISLAEYDAANHFRALAAKGSAQKGLAILDKLDAAFRGK